MILLICASQVARIAGVSYTGVWYKSLFIRTGIPSLETLPSLLNYLPKGPFPNAILGN
jgi:hypothetical protein